MNQHLENACSALDGLATTVVNTWGSDGTVGDSVGWFAPTVTRHDLADLARKLAADIRSAAVEELDEELEKTIADLPRRLQVLQSNTVPQMFGGNAGQAIPAYVSTIQILRAMILPGIGWQSVPDSKALPAPLARRARAAQAQLDQLAPDLVGLRNQIEEIQSAHKVADSLPIDLQALAEARERLTKASTEALVTEGKIKDAWEQSERHLKLTKQKQEEAQKLVDQCEDAYKITTTKGLAGAFDQRASRLALSMWGWVIGLIIALVLGSFIGAHRLEVLSAALQAPTPNWGGVAIQCVLSLLSVGAPLWFAWLATKQVGQRFRLAEDYAFKASIAKAYEGYRKEAARIDPDFEHRLFGSALSRLDEAPLRLVEAGTHGSPWHELANSDAVRRALDAAPEFRDKMIDLLREAVAASAKVLGKGSSSGDEKTEKTPVAEAK